MKLIFRSRSLLQNIPVTAVTTHVRDPQFCSEEWTGVS